MPDIESCWWHSVYGSVDYAMVVTKVNLNNHLDQCMLSAHFYILIQWHEYVLGNVLTKTYNKDSNNLK